MMLMQSMAQMAMLTTVFRMVKWTHQDSQYGESFMPIILMDSLDPDSFSFANKNTML